MIFNMIHCAIHVIYSPIMPTCYVQSMHAQAKMATAMGSTAKVMAATNKQMKLEDIQKTMANFDRESTKMDMAGEMSKSRWSEGIHVVLLVGFVQ